LTQETAAAVILLLSTIAAF